MTARAGTAAVRTASPALSRAAVPPQMFTKATCAPYTQQRASTRARAERPTIRPLVPSSAAFAAIGPGVCRSCSGQWRGFIQTAVGQAFAFSRCSWVSIPRD